MKRIYFDQERCLACKSCVLACLLKHSQTKNLFSALQERPVPRARISLLNQAGKPLAVQCRHCPDPYCVFACISGALKKEAGTLILDSKKCVHCYSCIMVCPYGAIRMLHQWHQAGKCDLCADQETAACVESCPTGALFYGEQKEFEKLIRKRRKACTT